MSDHLAPFVAAAIRDQVFDDLLEENRRLHQKFQELRTRCPLTIVTLTGTTLHVHRRLCDTIGEVKQDCRIDKVFQWINSA